MTTHIYVQKTAHTYVHMVAHSLMHTRPQRTLCTQDSTPAHVHKTVLRILCKQDSAHTFGQGSHCTGKTGKIEKSNSRQGKHREFENFKKTQGI